MIVLLAGEWHVDVANAFWHTYRGWKTDDPHKDDDQKHAWRYDVFPGLMVGYRFWLNLPHGFWNAILIYPINDCCV